MRVLSGRGNLSDHYAAARADITAALLAKREASSAAITAAQQLSIAKRDQAASEAAVADMATRLEASQLTVARLEAALRSRGSGVSGTTGAAGDEAQQKAAGAQAEQRKQRYESKIADLQNALDDARAELDVLRSSGIMGSPGASTYSYSSPRVASDAPEPATEGTVVRMNRQRPRGTGPANSATPSSSPPISVRYEGHSSSSKGSKISEAATATLQHREVRFLAGVEAARLTRAVVAAERAVAVRERRIEALQAELDAMKDTRGRDELVTMASHAKQVQIGVWIPA